MKLAYPACFYYEDEGYSVEFPDLKGCITQGDTLEEALEMAEDAALGWLLDELESGIEIPKATKIEDVKLERKGFVNLVLLDLGTYSEKYCKNLFPISHHPFTVLVFHNCKKIFAADFSAANFCFARFFLSDTNTH